LLPKYVKRVRARGRDYYYFDTGKKVDGKKVYARLPDLRSMDFGGSYAALMGHRNRGPKAERLTVPKVVDLYQMSPDYKSLSAASKKLYDIYLARLNKLLPVAPIAEIRKSDMRLLFDKMAATPGAANAFLRTSRTLFSWAIDREYATTNPCAGIEMFQLNEHQPWPSHILAAALVADDPRVRLVTHLLYFTAQRIGDALAMAWTDIDDGRVYVAQEKTKKKLGIRLHSRLSAELAKHSDRANIIAADDAGKPLKPGTVAKLLSEFTAKAGHRCVPHGLRKNAVIALLEAGCDMGQIASVSGQSLQMVEHYAKARNQVAMADAAMLKWQEKGS
jgi:integrase